MLTSLLYLSEDSLVEGRVFDGDMGLFRIPVFVSQPPLLF